MLERGEITFKNLTMLKNHVSSPWIEIVCDQVEHWVNIKIIFVFP